MLRKLPETVGLALQRRRAGMENTVMRHLLRQRDIARVEVLSSAFKDQEAIPIQYTADGVGISPPLQWRGVPEASSQVVLIVEDADSPTPQPLVHAIAVPERADCSLAGGALASDGNENTAVQMGLNSYLQHRWIPPDPPPGHGPHRYVFQVFALREGAELSQRPGRHELVEAVLDRAIAAGALVGLYERQRRQRVARDDLAIADVAAADAAP